MTSIRFDRPTPALLSMNDRHHWRRKAQDVKAWRAVAFGYGFGVKAEPAMVVVTLDVHGNRRRDPANFFPCVKAIVDGLVDADWWPDDTPEYVTVCEPMLRVVPRTSPLTVHVMLVPR